MTITFIGHGYVGLVTAAVFADLGNTVWVIGHTIEKIENLKKGIIPIYEPGLEEVVKRNIAAERLLFTLDYEPSIKESDVVFIAVGTPPKENGEADLSVVYTVAEQVGKHLENYTVVVTKSTVPVGTSKKVKEIIEKAKNPTSEFDYGSVPEFLREGQALSDTFHPDRIILGTETKKAEEVLSELHKPFTTPEEGEVPILITDVPTAEMIKYASNAFLATKISFANSIAYLSELTGANGLKVLEGIGLDKRIGSAFLNPGSGYGGSCFPKDVKALIAIAKNAGYEFTLLQEVEHINEEAMGRTVKKAEELLGNNLSGKTIAVLGLSFKPDTDDMREAPAITVIETFVKKGALVKVYDPIAMENAKLVLPSDGVTYHASAYDAAERADVVVIMTEWNEFRQLNLEELKSRMKEKNIVDGRNIFDPKKVKQIGFHYLGIGR